MKNKSICLNEACSKKYLCDSCKARNYKRIVKIILSVVILILLLITSFIEYKDGFIWFFNSIGDFLVGAYEILPSFIRTFLKVSLYSIPVLLILGFVVFFAWLFLEDSISRY